MRTKLISRVLPYLLVFGFFLFDLSSIHNQWNSYPPLNVLKLVLFVLAAGWLVWRGFFAKVGLPKTGLDTGILAFSLAFLLNLLFTPEPRLAWPVLSSFLRVIFLLYFFLDLFDTFPPGNQLFSALLILNLLLQISVAVEIVTSYTGWWNAVGSIALPPFPYRYKGVFFYSNTMTVYSNILAPLALVGLIRPWKRFIRPLCAVWLVLFAFCLPFSSSRSGWLGSAAWVGVICIFIVIQQKWYQKYLQIGLKHRLLIAGGFVLGAFILGSAGLLFLKTFGAHPSHGVNIYGGRSQIWGTVLHSFVDSPLFGSGAGRLGLEYLGNATSIPPLFWALQAHSTYLQVLAEFGLTGFVSFVLVLFLLFRWFFRSFKKAPAVNQLILAAVGSGLMAFLVQSVFDIFTYSSVLMDQFLLLLVAAVLLSPVPLKRFKRLRFSAVFIPLTLFFTWFMVYQWLNQPISKSIEPLRQGDLSEVEIRLSEAAQRDPGLRYNHDALALVSSWQAYLQNDPGKLDVAINELNYVLDTSSAPTLWTANLAVMEWSSGDRASGMTYMQKAIDLAPLEPTFYLNLGSMLEEMGQTQASGAAYCQALQLRPAWQEHPFWNLTPERRQSANDCFIPKLDESPWWPQAQQAILAGDLDQAAIFLANSDWLKEDRLAYEVTHGLLLEAQGKQEQACKVWEESLRLLARPIIQDNSAFINSYANYFERPPLPFELVPGYLQILPDVGQFYAMDKLADWYRSSGDEAKLTWLEEMRNLAITGAVQYTPAGGE